MTIQDFQKHGETAKADLPLQFKDLPNIEGLIDAFAPQFNELDSALIDLALERTIDNATGASLVQLASIVNIERGVSDDDDLRLRIRVEIAINRSEETIENVLGILSLALGDDCLVALDEYNPAAMVVRMNQATTAVIAERLADFISRARAAGVRTTLEYSTADDDDTFQFASGDSPEADTDAGWATDSYPITGGQWAGCEEA